MSPRFRMLLVAVILASGATLPAQDKPATDDGFKPMFNGKDLSGWVNVNCHPDTFFVRGDEIITTGKPTGFLRTDKQYENFILEMDWMHVNRDKVGNSGLFVWGDPLPAVGTGYTRGIEVQVLVNLEYKDKMGRVTATSHGDLFSIWGAKCKPDRPHPSGSERCLPSEYRAKGGGEWNHYKVTANNGTIKLEVNGKEVSGVSQCNPRKGYLALESEDAECHFKNIRIKELPSTNPKQEEIAKVAEGHKSLFNGLDLTGWMMTNDDGSWKAGGGVLKCIGKKAGLVSKKKFDKCELVFDWKLPANTLETLQVSVGPYCATVLPDGVTAHTVDVVKGTSFVTAPGKKLNLKPGAWNRSVIRFDGDKYTWSVNDISVGDFKPKKADDPLGSIMLIPAEGLEIMNVFVRELKEEKK